MDPNQKLTDWHDSEPLGWSASLGNLAATIKLIQLGADPLRPKNKSGYTPLTDAKREKYEAVIKFLEAYELRASILDPDTFRSKIANVHEFKINQGTVTGVVEFSVDGSFYNHLAEMSGEWHIDHGSAADGDGPKLIMNYPDNKIEAAFAVIKIYKGGIFHGGIRLKCVRSTGHFMSGVTLKPKSTQPDCKLMVTSDS
jgi:hypothetical protein